MPWGHAPLTAILVPLHRAMHRESPGDHYCIFNRYIFLAWLTAYAVRRRVISSHTERWSGHIMLRPSPRGAACKSRALSLSVGSLCQSFRLPHRYVVQRQRWHQHHHLRCNHSCGNIVMFRSSRRNEQTETRCLHHVACYLYGVSRSELEEHPVKHTVAWILGRCIRNYALQDAYLSRTVIYAISK